jgi:NCAIR mutase (PurE)-related protein
MTEETIKALLDAVIRREVTVDEAVTRLRALPFEDLGFARVDHHRAIRCGFPEVVYCEGKTVEQVATIIEKRAATGSNVLATRAAPEMHQAVAEKHPDACYHEFARAITLRQRPAEPSDGTIAIVSAGTSDMPVAEEARVTAECTTSAWRGSIACWLTPGRSSPPTWWSSWPAWKARWPAWSAGWSIAR